MSRRPIRCRACGCTELDEVSVTVDEQVSVCRQCSAVNEWVEVDEVQAKEDLVLRLEQLREAKRAPRAVQRSGSPTVSGTPVLLGLGLVAALVLLAWGALIWSEQATAPSPSAPTAGAPAEEEATQPAAEATAGSAAGEAVPPAEPSAGAAAEEAGPPRPPPSRKRRKRPQKEEGR